MSELQGVFVSTTDLVHAGICTVEQAQMMEENSAREWEEVWAEIDRWNELATEAWRAQVTFFQRVFNFGVPDSRWMRDWIHEHRGW